VQSIISRLARTKASITVFEPSSFDIRLHSSLANLPLKAGLCQRYIGVGTAALKRQPKVHKS